MGRRRRRPRRREVCNRLEPGSLHVEFGKAEDLLAKLFELSKAAANDFEAFRSAAERR